MKRYDSYKNSGVEWMNEIPSNWEKSRIRMVGDLYGGLTGKKGSDFNDEDNPSNKPFVPFTNIFNNTYISKDHFQYVNVEENENQNRVLKNDLFFLMSSESYEDLGKCSILLDDVEELYLNSFCKGFRIKDSKVYPLFLNYQLLGSLHKEMISVEGNGFTRINLRQDRLLDIPVFIPPMSEQQKIVSFLDTKTSIIDSLIEKTRRKIELLKEGIMSCIFYKSSTNYFQDYWFQNIPDGWKILKFREVFEDIVDKGHTDERLLSVHQIKGVIYRDEQEQSVMNPSGDISNYKLIKEGDFVISLRSSEGGFEFSQVRGLVSPVYTVLRPKFKIDTVLFKYLFKSENFIQEINRYITGIREGKTINYKDIRDIPIPIPDNFQESVVSKHLKILKLFDLWEKRNNKLKEYRQSLISEVVTGKRKVIE